MTWDEVNTAESVAHRAHNQQVDKQDAAYIGHPQRVAAAVPKEYRVIAWLHDVAEDDAELWKRERDQFRMRDVTAVELLTRTPQETYAQYIDRIAASGNVAAVTVKLADLRDNLRRGAPGTLYERYHRAIERLTRAEQGFKLVAQSSANG